ncbi:hypothetical protein KR51_00025760 [Rubidibacter lacunae KORDI 51-2]|uniref:Hemolysin-type calcium-binding repeat (2 copies) n=1 Tax=Rubidibacter lacunae KORDI 51-2 TaxID=582515 RepID=U5DMC8_9CHRO|nr:hypothetical protein [Rubidibacter lacunae]ERN40865.1 hypothetical protein KR51_00025760 [Rubidibacter lacunae KORDI 51-2]
MSDNLILGGPGDDVLPDTLLHVDVIVALEGNDTIFLGDDGLDDLVFAGAGDDTIEISDRTGSNTIVGGTGVDTTDYSTLGESITLNPLGTIAKASGGVDLIESVEVIIGATGAGIVNIIDGSPIGGSTNAVSLDVDLSSDSLIVNNIPGGPLSSTVQNFSHVIGTQNNDVIRGDNGTNVLIGGAGDDIIFGEGFSFADIDTLAGVEGTFEVDSLTGNFIFDFGPFGSNPGQGELDQLIGGSSPDDFILGDPNSGPFYVGGGNTDFAFISDFDPTQDLLIFDPLTPFIEIPGAFSDRELYWDLNFNGILDAADDLFAVVDFL